MAYKIDQNRIDKFYEDRQYLPYNDAEIAARMGIGKSNYSRYMNSRAPITNVFLKKFYAAFGAELESLRQEQNVSGLEEKMAGLESRVERLFEDYRVLSREFRGLAEKLDQTVDQKLTNIETLLTSLLSGRQ